jgi:hypothetical protein
LTAIDTAEAIGTFIFLMGAITIICSETDLGFAYKNV